MKFKQKEGFILRQIMDEFMLFPVDENIKKFQGTILLNDLSAFIWNELKTFKTIPELVEIILSEYEIDEVTVANDLKILIKQFIDYEIIESI